ncbi:ZIP family metal transporter [Candidatus Bathyarchaeota archaeon]|nr:ZIP family metal transporter [Candidatus Bathyarchaeota archaeon]
MRRLVLTHSTMATNMARHLEPSGTLDHDHPPACELESQDDGNTGLRIASIFIVFAAALLGALLPVFLGRSASAHVPTHLFFAFKFIGTGVIIGTAWMHLLSPAVKILGDPCLQPRFGGFDWGSAIAGMTLMAMFLVHLLVTKLGPDTAEEATVEAAPEAPRTASVNTDCSQLEKSVEAGECSSTTTIMTATTESTLKSQVGDSGAHCDVERAHSHNAEECPSSLAFSTQLTAIFILEFGVIFHSVFIGLVLATTDDLVILLVVLVFHQLFEGLGLGARLALVSWPKSRRWLPYALCLAFAVSTPLGTAVGLGARPENAEAQMLTNGIFDAVSAGILLYTGVFELMGREFFFNSHMRHAPLKQQLYAYGYVAVGFTIMTVLAKWA